MLKAQTDDDVQVIRSEKSFYVAVKLVLKNHYLLVNQTVIVPINEFHLIIVLDDVEPSTIL